METKSNKKGKKAKVEKTASLLNFINVEDEVFLKVRMNFLVAGKIHLLYSISCFIVRNPECNTLLELISETFF